MLTDDYNTDTRYLNEADADFSHLSAWTLSSNRFERRMAANLTPETRLLMEAATLIRVIGTAAATRQIALTLDIALSNMRNDIYAAVRVVSCQKHFMPPITADNAINLHRAIRWFSRRQPKLCLTVAHGDLFWIRGTEHGSATHPLA